MDELGSRTRARQLHGTGHRLYDMLHHREQTNSLPHLPPPSLRKHAENQENNGQTGSRAEAPPPPPPPPPLRKHAENQENNGQTGSRA